MAISIAAALSMMLGAPESGESNCSSNVHSLIWRWLEVFLLKSYLWEFSKVNHCEIRKYAILQGLCHKMGIELAPRDFDMDSPNPFQKVDIVRMVTVHKALGRTPLTNISPKKTLEGAFASLSSCILVALILSKILCWPTSLLSASAFGVLNFVGSPFGDLIESMIKRDAGVKDSGSLIPGRVLGQPRK